MEFRFNNILHSKLGILVIAIRQNTKIIFKYRVIGLTLPIFDG
jgi:hypothetical protein